MGANDYSMDTLISNITLTGHVPTGNSTFTPENLAVLANREMETPILKQILSSRGNYYLTYEDLPASTDGLYDIPSGCVGGAVYNIELIQNVTVIQVQAIEISEQFSTNTPNATTYGFYMKGNQIQILPTPPIGSTRIWYYKRPSQLVLNSACCKINEVDVINAIVTVDSIPSNIGVGDLIDIVGNQPPFNVIASQMIVSVAGMVIALDAAPSNPISVGNYVALNEQTCIPPIPVEYRPLLEQRTICSIYEIQKNKDGLKMARDKLEELEKDCLGLITNRVKSKTTVINVTNGGFLAGRNTRGAYYQVGREN